MSSGGLGPVVATAVVAMGGGVGAAVRYWIARVVPAMTDGHGMPWATLIVNTAGSAAIGVALHFAASAERGGHESSEFLRLLLVTGLLGGLTTFSALSGEIVELVRHERVGAAIFVAGLNLGLGVGVCGLAYWISGVITRAIG